MTDTPPPPPKKIRRRGRPEITSEQKTQMQSRISKIAGELFKTEGYAKVSMRRIAKEIGYTPMTLYRYYDSKIDILRSLWGDVFTTLFHRLDEIPTSPTPQERLIALGLAYVQYWLEHPEEYHLVFMAEGVTQPEVSLFLDNPEIINKYTLFLETINKTTEGNTSSSDLKTKLDFFLSTLHGIAHNHVTISGYEWSAPRAQIQLAVRAVSG